MKQVCLHNKETLIDYHVSIVKLINKMGGYLPQIHLLINTASERDYNTQLNPFLKELDTFDIERSFLKKTEYYNEAGHGGMPSKEQCILIIHNDLINHVTSPERKDIMDDKKKLYLVMTIDTEDKCSSIPNMIECDFGEAGNCGVNYIMDQFEKRNMRGVFFVNIYEHNNFKGKYEGYMPELLKRIDSRGHEIGLHTHEYGCKLPFYKKALSSSNYTEQKEIIEYGMEYIHNCINKYPISHRGGAYRCNEVTFNVLSDLNFKIDSSVFYSDPHTGNLFPFFYGFNQVHMINKLIEFPVVNGFNKNGVLKKFDPNSLNEMEIIDFIKQMKKRDDFSCAQLMFHSFSFIDQKADENKTLYWTAGSHNAYGISQPLMSRFEAVLDYIQSDPDIEVITFEEYIKRNIPLQSFWGDGIFYSNADKAQNAATSYLASRFNRRIEAKNENKVFDELNMDFAFDYMTLNRYFSDNEVLSLAHELLNGNLTVYKRIEPLSFSIENFNWNIQHSNIPNTFQLYLHSLNFLQILVRAYELKKEVKYLKTAYELIKSWYSFALKKENISNNKYVYCDHSVALRSDNLIYFAKICNDHTFWDKDMFDLIRTILEESGKWLADEKNYTKAHNHGVMEDKALLHIGFCMQNNEWIDLAKKRLTEQKKTAFNEEYVHTENSPAYAQLVRKMFLDIADFLEANNDDFGSQLRDDMKMAEEYINWTIKPNGIIAQVGDSSNPVGVLYADKSKLIRHSETTHAVFPITGQYFFRSNSADLPQNDTWKFIKSGYSNTTHKHADDLSFMLYSKGYEIFTDSGIYGYKNDIYRKYFASALAHNSIIVDNQSYIADRKHMECVGMTDYSFFDEYDRVSVFNKAYQGVCINRDFCSDGDLTILYDYVESDDYHVYSQLFHLAENISVVSSSDRHVRLKIGDTGYFVDILQLGDPCRIQVINGNKSIPQYGLISRTENHIDTISTLKFDMVATFGLFTTVIAITNAEGYIRLNNNKKCKIDDLDFNNNTVVIKKMNICLESSYSQVELDNAVKSTSTVQKENHILFKLDIHKPYIDRLEYAYYLYKNGEVIEKRMYSSITEQTFDIKQKGTYRVKYYLSCGEQKKSYFGDTIKVK